jgi:predicted GIY-YIG superfamily endonuclease
MAPTEDPWQFYIVYHLGCKATYAGVSPDPERRLRMHNGEICGGAKYTTSKGAGWVHICLIKGFPTKQNAMQFEWAIKHVPPRNVGGLESRLRKLGILLRKERWTSKSPLACEVPLEIMWKGVSECEAESGSDSSDSELEYDCPKNILYGVDLDEVVGTLPDYISWNVDS